MRTTIVHDLDELASLHTHTPLACGLRSVSMTKPTMSWQGQAEQPMILRVCDFDVVISRGFQCFSWDLRASSLCRHQHKC